MFESTTVPAPVFVIPKPPEITPERVKVSPVAALSVLSAVNVMLPASELVTSLKVPPAKVIFSAPIATLYRSKVAPLLTVVPPAVVPRPALLLMSKVPADTVVVPL